MLEESEPITTALVVVGFATLLGASDGFGVEVGDFVFVGASDGFGVEVGALVFVGVAEGFGVGALVGEVEGLGVIDGFGVTDGLGVAVADGVGLGDPPPPLPPLPPPPELFSEVCKVIVTEEEFGEYWLLPTPFVDSIFALYEPKAKLVNETFLAADTWITFVSISVESFNKVTE